MSWQAPVPGLVIRYAYLWRREADQGRDEAAKDRPAAIVLTVHDERAQPRVYALPITHSPPSESEDAIEIPAAAKRRLGLDEARSWIMLTEANVFVWPGPDLRMSPGSGPESSAYGMLPPAVFREISRRFLARAKLRRLRLVPRTD